MPFFQASDIKISSGYSGESISTIQMVQGINVSYSIQRQSIDLLGNTRGLKDKQIVNFVPIKYSIDLIKSDNLLEESLGLMNPSGVAMYIGNSQDNIGYGSRNIYADIIDEESSTYQNRITLNSGILQSYSVASSVGDVTKVSINGESTDLSINPNISDYNNQILSSIVKSNDIFISGIQFSGMGISGFSVQSFDLNLTFSRQSDIRYGKIYPERNLIGANGTLSVNGFIENFKQNSGIFFNNDNLPQTGSYYFTLNPRCKSYQSTTYKITNPYFESFSLGSTIGSFTAVQLGFSVPISFSQKELYDMSNITII